jgi:Tol biopolymer transport system component
VRDRLLYKTGIVSIHTSGAQGAGECEFPSISGDGRYVAFETSGTSLVNGDTNNSQDIFLRDRTSGITSRISVATFGTEANNDSQRPALSGDGRYVVFWSIADNLAGDDTNGVGDVFRRGPIR